MPHIVLTDEQASVIDQARETVEVRRNDGRVVTRIEPTWSSAEIEEIRRQATISKYYTGEQVRAYLQALEREFGERGTYDEARAKEILSQFSPVG